MGIKADQGDWIVGFTNAARGNKLVFAMEVLERIHFNDYFIDVRFQRKKPQIPLVLQLRQTLNHLPLTQSKRDDFDF